MASQRTRIRWARVARKVISSSLELELLDWDADEWELNGKLFHSWEDARDALAEHPEDTSVRLFRLVMIDDDEDPEDEANWTEVSQVTTVGDLLPKDYPSFDDLG